MSRNNSFWSNFWGETGRNSGKWVSNKVFGLAGWATPKRHIFNNEIKIAENAARKTSDDWPDSPISLKESDWDNRIEKNVATNEFDVKIAEIESKTLSESIVRLEKENKFSFLIAIAVVGLLFIFVFIMYNYNNNKRIADEEVHLRLEKIELQINLFLKEGKKTEASVLVFELNHPSNKPMPSSTSVKEWLNGQETYSNYWIKKRAYYTGTIK